MINHALILLLLFIAVHLLYTYFKSTLDYFKNAGIPYAPGWPVLGNMAKAFFRRVHVNDLVKELYSANPAARYVGAFDFMDPVIMLRDPELIKSVTIKNFDHFPDHMPFFDDTADPLIGSNLFNMCGDRWKEARSLLSPAFTSRRLKEMYESMVRCAENVLDCIDCRSDRRMIGTKDLFTRYANDVIASCIFGLDINSLKERDNQFYKFAREATNLDGSLSVKLFLSRAFPKVVKWLRIKFMDDVVRDFFIDLIKRTVSMRDESNIRRTDVIQLMMDARDKHHEHLAMNLGEMSAQAFIFLFGGFDTTSTQMCICAHELAINPGIQRRLQDEVDAVLAKSEGKVSYEDVNGMIYLDAIFNESMRRHTLACFIDRVCREEFELPPALPDAPTFKVPVGMKIWIPAAAIHSDAKHYENPDRFDPDRYLEKKVTTNDMLNLGFGIGPRSCLGSRFAALETKVLLFHLLARFDLVPNDKTCAPLVYSKKFFNLTAEGGYWLGIERRSDNA